MPSTAPVISDKKTKEALTSKLEEVEKKELEKYIKQKADMLGVFFVLPTLPIPALFLSILPKESAEKNKAVVYYKDSAQIKIAAADPLDESVQNIARDLQKKYNLPVEVNITNPSFITEAIRGYDFIPQKTAVGFITLDDLSIQELVADIKDFRDIADKIRFTSISEFINILIVLGIKMNASDIHLEPEAGKAIIRFRVDGILHKIFNLSSAEFNDIKKRIKLTAKLKLNIQNKPQDGGLTVTLQENKIDLRVSTMPSNFGESMVIRILNPQAVILDFDALGIRKEMQIILENGIKKPNGMIIICGPTGSGKTTTLYTILNKLNTEERKIVTLENPIEFKIAGIIQTQIDPEKLNFASGLKAILRQDPDILMVGEIRDIDTAETSVHAALTGHLLFSTLHTNNASAAIPRFISMGVKPFLLAPSLNIILGQRLVRKICLSCKTSIDVNSELLKKAKKKLAELPEQFLELADLSNLTFYQGKGCADCSGLGYKGRIGIFELLKIDDKIREITQQGSPTEQIIAQYAAQSGMITMAQDGVLKAIDGITTLDEVFRVTD